MLLDLQAARAIARARAFERAVNDPGPWAIQIGDEVQPIVRVRTQAGVCFIAHFDDGADPDETTAWLLCRGEEVFSRQVQALREPFVMNWKVSMSGATETVSV